MQHIISSQQIRLTEQNAYITRPGLLSKFVTWCNVQEEKRFLWLAIALLVGIGTIVPLTLFSIMVGANSNFTLWVVTCIVNVPVLVVNLAAQPTRVTLPVLFFAWLTDAIIITYCTALFISSI